jgi:hypothetical protein
VLGLGLVLKWNDWSQLQEVKTRSGADQAFQVLATADKAE